MREELLPIVMELEGKFELNYIILIILYYYFIRYMDVFITYLSEILKTKSTIRLSKSVIKHNV